MLGRRHLAGIVFACLVAQTGAAQEKWVERDHGIAGVLSQAQALLTAQRAADAWTLLAAHELEMAGTPLYDYLLGLAALDSGRPRDAAFALERVVGTEPDFVGARIELARAQFELSQFADARAQFNYLLTQSPPPETRKAIDRYLAAIDQRSTAGESRWSGLLQLGAGYDSNANGSTDATQFLGFTLNPRNTATSSGFSELTGAVGHSKALSPDSGIVSRLQLSHRFNPQASFVDQSIASFASNYIYQPGQWRWSAGINANNGWLHGSDHDFNLNLDFTGTRRFGNRWELSASLRGGQERYHEAALKILDVDQTLGGLSLTRIGLGDQGGRVGIALLAGHDRATRGNSPYGNDKLGGRAFTSWLLRPQSSLYLETSVLRSDYDGSGFFGADRKDKQYGALVAMDFQNWPGAGWSVNPRLRYIKNDSNIPLYTYDRIEASLYIQHSF